MLKWPLNNINEPGEEARFKKLCPLILGILVLVFIISTTQYIYAQTAEKTLQGNPPGDWPIFIVVIAFIVIGVIVKILLWARERRTEKRREIEARLDRVRRYGEGCGDGR